MKKILVPVDFSEESLHAVDLAHQIAEKSGASVKLLHIIEVPSGKTFSAYADTNVKIDPRDHIYVIEMMKAMERRFEELIHRDTFKNITLKYKIEIGNPFKSISAEITDENVDLVVMGTTGASGLAEVVVGSNAEKVVRRAPCPVITLRQKASLSGLKNIVYASSLDKTKNYVISRVKSLQEMLSAKIHLLKVITPSDFETTRATRKAMEEFIAHHKLSNVEPHLYNDFSEEEGITHFADDVNADFIAMATHGRTGFAHLLAGSIAEDVVNASKRPVWTCKIED